jgi:alkaline phosphatase D
VHGYDPYEVSDMGGIFYVQGPDINEGITLPPFQNVHIYPFIAKIMQLKSPMIDGKIEVLNALLKKE